MRNTKSKIIIMMCAVLCIMAVGYAAFSTVLTITGTANIASEWKVVFTDITQVSKTSGVSIKSTPVASGTTATFDVGLTSPGDKIVYKITLANQGTIDAVIKNIGASANDSPAIIFTVEGVNVGDELRNKTSKDFTVTIEYDPHVTSQPDKLQKTLTVSIVTEQYVNQSIDSSTPNVTQPLYLRSEILKNNIAYADTNIDFSQTSEATGTNGLYVTSTNTEGNLPTYYFRGAVDNNYVKFGTYTKNTCTYEGSEITYADLATETFIYDLTEEQCESTTVCSVEGIGNMVGLGDVCAEVDGINTGKYATYTENVTKDRLWRIVRINEDGSIRIVTQDIVGTSPFNTEYGDNAYVGYMYGATGQSGSNGYALTHTNTTDSAIKDYLDDWYTANLSSYASKISNEAGFCNDRSVAPSADLWYSNDTALGYAKNYTVYGSAGRLTNNWEVKENAQPQYACPNESRDLFTMSSATKGNKMLTKPIGLLTMDEVAYAGAVYGELNESMYLTNDGVFWTLSPFEFRGAVARAWGVDGDGYADYGDVDTGCGVRPVVNLKSTVEIIGGDGQLNTPYVIG